MLSQYVDFHTSKLRQNETHSFAHNAKVNMKVNKMNKKFISTSILLAATTIGASANAQQSLDGLYVSGKIGSSSLNHTIERNIGDTTLPVQDTSGVTTANDAGVSFGGAIGYTYDLTDSFFVGA